MASPAAAFLTPPPPPLRFDDDGQSKGSSFGGAPAIIMKDRRWLNLVEIDEAEQHSSSPIFQREQRRREQAPLLLP
nr:hypothetical protein Itr_chr03CG07470 [Ipomoea trifida]